MTDSPQIVLVAKNKSPSGLCDSLSFGERVRVRGNCFRGIFVIRHCLSFNTFGLLAAVLLALTSCKPKDSQVSQDSAQALGLVLAEEALHAAGPKKEVVLILPNAVWGSSSPVEQAFRAALKKAGTSIVVGKVADAGDPMRSGPIGLKPADFFDVLEKFPAAGAIVSFAGVPLLSAADFVRLNPNHPPLLVLATANLGNLPAVPTDRTQLARQLDAKIIKLAIIDNSDAAPQPGARLDATHQLFAEHYRILRQPE